MAKAPLLIVLVTLATSAAVPATADRPACAASVEQPLGGGTRGYVATVLRSARAYERPGGTMLERFVRVGIDGGPAVFAVVGRLVDGACRTRWYHVQVPLRPNGATAYVHAFAVRLSTVRTRIVVDVARRRLTFLHLVRAMLAPPRPVRTAP